MNQAIYKVPNGKLVKIFLDHNQNRISKVKITGDFFIYPEEKITNLEEAVANQELNEESLTDTLSKTITEEKLELFGVDAASIAKTILMASQ